MHHARTAQAGGHCYVNDAVLAILELLRYHARVLYIDIDMFHGDGVEEAFYSTDRVMTMSFHKYGDGAYPGSGSSDDVGEGTVRPRHRPRSLGSHTCYAVMLQGKGFSVNVPLKDGIRDEPFLELFTAVVGASVKRFSPDAIVMQCGAGSLAGDRIGSFNLTHVGHCALPAAPPPPPHVAVPPLVSRRIAGGHASAGGAVEYVCDLELPTLLLGGGG